MTLAMILAVVATVLSPPAHTTPLPENSWWEESPLCEPETLVPDRVVTVLASLRREGLVQRRNPIPFTAPRSVSRDLLVSFLKDPSVGFKYGPRSVPLVIALHETGFQNLRGDHHLGGGIGISCGLTQIRTDYPGRPSCNSLLEDPEKALHWTATHLNRLYRAKACLENGRCLSRYAGAGPKAREFEQWVLKVATFAETHAQYEDEAGACLPLGLEVR